MSARNLNISRVWLLIRLELYQNKKGLGLTAAVTFGMLFFVGMLLALVVEPQTTVYDPHDEYSFTLIVGGFIMTSLSFSKLSHSLRRNDFLMLPVSSLERFFTAWVLTTVGWVVLYTFAYWIYSLLANPLGSFIFNKVQFVSFEILHPTTILSVRVYLTLQGIFLVGATQFRGYVLLKTLFAIIIFLTVCGMLIYFILRESFFSNHLCTADGECELVDAVVAGKIWTVASWLFWYVLAPLSWFLAYIGLKEQEV